jgi:hypothetical protein
MSVHPHTASTWTLQSGVFLQKVAIDPTNQFMVAIQYNGQADSTVVYSRDFGVTWTASTGITGNVTSISSNGYSVLVGVNGIVSNLYYSNDYGTSFVTLTNSPQSYWSVVGVCEQNSSYMVACDFINDTATIYYSNDQGNNWSSLNSYNGIIITGGAWSNNDNMNTMYFVGYMTSAPYYSGMFITRDQGSSWVTFPDYSPFIITDVACDRTGQNVLISVSQDGVYRSIDSARTWAKTTAPSVLPSGPNMGQIVCDDTGNHIVVLDIDSKVLYASSDAGTTWSLETTAGSDVADGVLNISMSPDGSYRFASFITTGTYSLIVPEYKLVNFSNGSVNRLIKVVGSNNSCQHMVAIGSNQYGSGKCLVYSNDYGLTWNLSDADASGDSLYTCIAASANGQYVVAGFQNGPNGVVFSNNYGVHYSIVTAGFNFVPSAITISDNGQFFYAMSCDNTGAVYVGTVSGSVVVQNSGIPAMFWKSVACDSTGEIVYATAQVGGTSAYSMYKAQFGTPYAHLPMNNDTMDVMGNSTISVTGTISYVTGIVTPAAANLVNTAGSNAANYLLGTWAGSDNCTVSMWFNLQSTGAIQTLFSAYSTALYLYVNPSNELIYSFPSGGDINSATITGPVITPNTWYNVSILFQTGGMCALYLNNLLAGSHTNVSGVGSYTTSYFGIGTYDVSDYGQALNGYIDDFKLYSSAGTYGMWTEIPRFASSPLIPLAVTCDSMGDVVSVAAGTDGVYQSMNSGVSWTLKDALTGSIIDPNAIQSFTPIQSGLSTNSWTNNGVKWMSSASTYMTNQDPFIPFRNELMDSWNTTSYTYTPSGNSSGIFNTFYTSGTNTVTVQGDWLQLKSSEALIMESYEIGCGNANNLPTMFYIIGSNDGVNWHALQYASAGAKPFDAIYQMVPGVITVNSSSGQSWGNTTLTTTAYPGATQSYTHFRMIVLSSFYAPGTIAQIGKWIINFVPAALPFIRMPLDGSVVDLKGNSAVTSYGSMAYDAGTTLMNAAHLVNTVGATPVNYIKGTCPITADFIMSIRFNPQTFDAGTQPIIMGLGTASYTLVQLVMNSATTLTVQLFKSNSQWTVLTLGTLTADTWYNAVIVFQVSGTVSAYLNDSLVASTAGFSLYAPIDTFSLSTYTHETSGAFNGYIADVRIYTLDNLFIYLPFDTNVNDVQGNSTVTVYGNSIFIDGPAKPLALNLVNIAGETPANYLQGTCVYSSQFTADVRFNLHSTPNSTAPSTIFSIGTPTQTFLMLNYCNNTTLFGVSSFNGLVAWGYDASNTPFVIGTTNISTGEWYQFRLVYNLSGMITVYLNGVPFGFMNGVGLLNTPTMYSFGSDCHAAVNAMNGSISDFRVYGAALSPPTTRSFTMIAGDASGANLAIGDTVNGYVYRSFNSGATWDSQIIRGAPESGILSLSMDATGTYVFTTYDGLEAFMSQRSAGLTTNWTVTNGKYYPITTYSNSNQYQTAINSLYGFTTTGHSIISYSTDSGATWTDGPDLGAYVNGIAADSTGQYVVAVLELDMTYSSSVYRSTDYGATFTVLGNSPSYYNTGLNCIACNSTGQYLYSGAYDSEVFVSHNAGVDWVSYTLPSYIADIICSHSGQYVYALSGEQICISTNYGQTWSGQIGISMSGCSQIACDWSGQYIVAACYNDGIYRSTDYGQTWTKTSAPSNPYVGNCQYYYYIACNSTGNRILTFDTNNVNLYLSTNAGATWVLQYTPGSESNEAFMGVNVSPDGTNYEAGFWAPGSYRLLAGSPDIPASVPCFLEGTQILCQIDGVEQYKAVETIRPGMLVKTSRDGFKPVKLIGSRSMNNSGTADRHKNSLYVCKKEKYPELTADLTITGCHAILVDKITEVQRAGILQTLERIFVTDRRYRLPACVDERTDVLQTAGPFTVWHFALEHYDTRMNFGVYAQGLLVESSPICHMTSKNYNLV